MKLRRCWTFQPGWALAAPALQLPILLIFFLLSASSVLLQPGLSVTIPESPFILSPVRDPLVVTIGPGPLAPVYFENREVGLAVLRESLRAQRGRARTLVLRADQGAPFDRVAAVLTIALEEGLPVVLATRERADAP